MTPNEKASLPVFPPSQADECAPLLTWEALFDAIEDGVCVQSIDSRIVCANRAFADIIGAPLEQVIGRPCSEVFGCANETGAIPQFCARLLSDETGRAEYEEIGGKRPGQRLRSRVSQVRDDSGKIIAYLMVVRDITETVAHEREINRRQQSARFGELAASLAHEIKNPLAGIQGAVDILIRRRNPNDPERQLLEGVRGEVGRIDAIVQSMLDRARPGAFNFQPASVNAAAHRAVTLAGHQAKAASTRGRQIKIEFVADPSPIVMSIDGEQLEDAVHGLLTNAIEAIDGHGAVIVRLGECDNEDGTGREVVIEVKDSGRGISEEDLARIFSPFFSTNPNGAGLGLSAVKRVARAHGGRVEVSSTPGLGSTFTIRLPRQ
ncbi:MAG TPA: ATP-binding protein [Blastocatellia bacterium]|jgi:PAS domain S-box-containing protein|nr:ATP-binding protein [Blastocatellia bacterium]